MIELKKISISNYGSYGKGPTVINLNQKKKTMIFGENLDVGADGESRNGAGKTLWLTAVVFAIYGQPIDRLRPDDLINLKNGKKLVVELDISIDGVDYQIRRGRKPAFVELTSGTKTLTRDSMDNTTKDIIALIGIPYDVFVRTVFMNPHIEPFMAMTPAKQRDFMEELLSLDVLTERGDALKKIIRKEIQDKKSIKSHELEASISANETVHRSIKALEAKSAQHENDVRERADELSRLIKESQIEEACRTDWDEYTAEKETKAKRYEECNAEIDLLEAQRKDLKYNIKMLKNLYVLRDEFDAQHNTAVEEAKTSLAKMPPKNVAAEYFDIERSIIECEEKIAQRTQQVVDTKRTRDEMDSELGKLIEQIESLSEGKCPYCKQDHFDQNEFDNMLLGADDLASDLTHVSERVNELEGIKEKLESELSKYLTDIKELRADYPDIRVYRDIGDFVYEKQRLENIVSKNVKQNPHELAICDIEIEMGGDGEEKMATLIDKMDVLIKEKEETYNFLCEYKAQQEIREQAEQKKRQIKAYEEELLKIKTTKNPYSDLIQEQKDGLIDVSKIEDDLAAVENELTHVNYLIKLLTDPKSFVRKNIVDTCIPYINQKMVQRTQELGLSHVCTINSDMSVDVDYMGHSVSYFTMSQGERLRLNVAAALAFRDMLKTLGKVVNILLVDELLDGSADTSGMNAIFDVISETTDDLFVISHREEFKDKVDRKMFITKKNGFSDIRIE